MDFLLQLGEDIGLFEQLDWVEVGLRQQVSQAHRRLMILNINKYSYAWGTRSKLSNINHVCGFLTTFLADLEVYVRSVPDHCCQLLGPSFFAMVRGQVPALLACFFLVDFVDALLELVKLRAFNFYFGLPVFMAELEKYIRRFLFENMLFLQ